MNYFLTKLVSLFVFPLGLMITLCILGLLLLRAGRRQIAISSILISILVLWIASTGVFADFVMGSLEQHYPPLEMRKTRVGGAIVILGGATRGRVPGTGITDLNGGSDRLFHGARLFKAGKAPLIILTGGNDEGYQPESEAMAEVLGFIGIPSEAMLLESSSRNTYQNGMETARILNEQGIDSILLVTSAYHMHRAKAVFENLGVTVISAATDYQVVERYASVLDWLPQSSALDRTTKGIKEYLGWWVYRWRGWV